MVGDANYDSDSHSSILLQGHAAATIHQDSYGLFNCVIAMSGVSAGSNVHKTARLHINRRGEDPSE